MKYTCFFSFIFLLFISFIGETIAQQGREIFSSKCASCHTIGSGKLVGPDLMNITDSKSSDWLKNFIRSSQSMVKNGDPDAVAIFNEFNKIPMPDQPLSDQEIDAVLNYISDQSKTGEGGSEEQTAAAQPKFEYKKADVKKGMALFKGKQRLQNRGVSCITCHTIKNDRLIAGGTLAKNLTATYQNMGAQGIMAILNHPPFPAMTESYKNHSLTEQEIEALTAFLTESSKQSYYQHTRDYATPFVIAGIILWTLLLGFFATIFIKRKRGSMNDTIYKRQLEI